MDTVPGAGDIHVSREVRTTSSLGHLKGTTQIDLVGVPMRYETDEEIYGEGETVEYVYKVVSGAVRTYKLLSDGRRQISSFHLPGDFFGLEAGDTRRFSAEAVSDCGILVTKRSSLLALAERDGETACILWSMTAEDLTRAQDHMLLLGRKSATEKVVNFLLDMAGRSPGRDTVELPMSRYDIADYLGLTIETVSRVLTALKERAMIELASSRRILLRNAVALRRIDA